VTVSAVQELLRSVPPPRLPRNSIGGRFNFSGSGELWYPRRSSGRDESWLKESVEQRVTRYGEYAGVVSRLSHTGSDADLREQFWVLVEPLKNLEEVILTTGLENRRRLPIQARKRLEERILVLIISKETNPEVASFFASKSKVGGERKLADCIQKWQSQQRKGGNGGKFGKDRRKPNYGKFGPQSFGGFGGGGVMAGGGAPGQFGGGFGGPSFGQGPQSGGFCPPQFQQTYAARMKGRCYDCEELGHRQNDPICKGVNAVSMMSRTTARTAALNVGLDGFGRSSSVATSDDNASQAVSSKLCPPSDVTAGGGSFNCLEDCRPAEHDARRGMPVGSIHDRVDHWESRFELDNFTRRILKEGYRVPLPKGFPEQQYEEKDNRSARDNYDFVRTEVRKLIGLGRVVEANCKPICINPLTVASKVKVDSEVKLRLVLDLSRKVNAAVDSDPFRLTTVNDALAATKKVDYQLVFDLTSAYHHIALHPESYELMGFAVTWESGETKYYYYVVLPFGYKRASQILGRMIKPIIFFLASEGI
jgi:hypothetical protein